MSCIIIKNDGIGDLIITSGIIAALSNHFGGKIDLVTCINNREIAENLYGVRKVFYVSRDGLRYNRYLERAGICLFPNISHADKATLQEIQTEEYDYAICLRRYIRASSLFIMDRIRSREKHCMWLFPSNISRRLAFRYSEGWRHYTGDFENINEIGYYDDFVKKQLNITIDPYPRLRCFEGVEYNPEPMKVGICIGGYKGNWPFKNWAELVRMLYMQGMKVCLFGGADTARWSSQIKKMYPGCLNYVGKLGLTESIDVLKSLNGFIGNETGFSHFASLIIPKVLIIYGGRTFGRFFPWPHSSNQHLIYYARNCFDCGGKCKYWLNRYRCLNSVKPTDVMEYFSEMVSNPDCIASRNMNPSEVIYPIAWSYYKNNKQYETIAVNREEPYNLRDNI